MTDLGPLTHFWASMSPPCHLGSFLVKDNTPLKYYTELIRKIVTLLEHPLTPSPIFQPLTVSFFLIRQNIETLSEALQYLTITRLDIKYVV